MAILGRNLRFKRSPGTLALGTDGVITLANGNMRYFGVTLPLNYDENGTIGFDLARVIQRIVVRSVHGELLILDGPTFWDFCRLGGGISVSGGTVVANDYGVNYQAQSVPGSMTEYHDVVTIVTAVHEFHIAGILELNSLPSSNIGCEITWAANTAYAESPTYTTAPNGTARCIQGFSPEAPDALIWYRSRVSTGLATGGIFTNTIPSARKGARVLWLAWNSRPAISADVTSVIPHAIDGYELLIEKAADTIAHIGGGTGGLEGQAIARALNGGDPTGVIQGMPLDPSALTDDDLTFTFTNNTGLTRDINIGAMMITGL